MTRKGQGLAYESQFAAKMLTWAERWDAAGEDVHGPRPPHDDATYAAYLRWYHTATRWRCFPVPEHPQAHDASITDTFASEPPAAFHALVSANTMSIT